MSAPHNPKATADLSSELRMHAITQRFLDLEVSEAAFQEMKRRMYERSVMWTVGVVTTLSIAVTAEFEFNFYKNNVAYIAIPLLWRLPLGVLIYCTIFSNNKYLNRNYSIICSIVCSLFVISQLVVMELCIHDDPSQMSLHCRSFYEGTISWLSFALILGYPYVLIFSLGCDWLEVLICHIINVIVFILLVMTKSARDSLITTLAIISVGIITVTTSGRRTDYELRSMFRRELALQMKLRSVIDSSISSTVQNECNQKLAEILKRVDTSFMEIDRSGCITYLSPFARVLLAPAYEVSPGQVTNRSSSSSVRPALDSNELLRMSHTSLVHPADQAFVKRICDRLMGSVSFFQGPSRPVQVGPNRDTYPSVRIQFRRLRLSSTKRTTEESTALKSFDPVGGEFIWVECEIHPVIRRMSTGPAYLHPSPPGDTSLFLIERDITADRRCRSDILNLLVPNHAVVVSSTLADLAAEAWNFSLTIASETPSYSSNPAVSTELVGTNNSNNRLNSASPFISFPSPNLSLYNDIPTTVIPTSMLRTCAYDPFHERALYTALACLQLPLGTVFASAHVAASVWPSVLAMAATAGANMAAGSGSGSGGGNPQMVSNPTTAAQLTGLPSAQREALQEVENALHALQDSAKKGALHTADTIAMARARCQYLPVVSSSMVELRNVVAIANHAARRKVAIASGRRTQRIQPTYENIPDDIPGDPVMIQMLFDALFTSACDVARNGTIEVHLGRGAKIPLPNHSSDPLIPTPPSVDSLRIEISFDCGSLSTPSGTAGTAAVAPSSSQNGTNASANGAATNTSNRIEAIQEALHADFLLQKTQFSPIPPAVFDTNSARSRSSIEILNTMCSFRSLLPLVRHIVLTLGGSIVLGSESAPPVSPSTSSLSSGTNSGSSVSQPYSSSSSAQSQSNVQSHNGAQPQPQSQPQQQTQGSAQTQSHLNALYPKAILQIDVPIPCIYRPIVAGPSSVPLDVSHRAIASCPAMVVPLACVPPMPMPPMPSFSGTPIRDVFLHAMRPDSNISVLTVLPPPNLRRNVVSVVVPPLVMLHVGMNMGMGLYNGQMLQHLPMLTGATAKVDPKLREKEDAAFVAAAQRRNRDTNLHNLALQNAANAIINSPPNNSVTNTSQSYPSGPQNVDTTQQIQKTTVFAPAKANPLSNAVLLEGVEYTELPEGSVSTPSSPTAKLAPKMLANVASPVDITSSRLPGAVHPVDDNGEVAGSGGMLVLTNVGAPDVAPSDPGLSLVATAPSTTNSAAGVGQLHQGKGAVIIGSAGNLIPHASSDQEPNQDIIDASGRLISPAPPTYAPLAAQVVFSDDTISTNVTSRRQVAQTGEELRISVPHPSVPVPNSAQGPVGAPPAIPPSGRSVETSGLNILFVDDEVTNRRLGGKMLNRLGCLHEELEDGELVLPRLRDSEASGQPFDVVLMDIVMPRQNGIDTCRKMREEGWTVPVVAMTGNTANWDLQLFHEAGFDMVLPKPFDVKAMKRALIMAKFHIPHSVGGQNTAGIGSVADISVTVAAGRPVGNVINQGNGNSLYIPATPTIPVNSVVGNHSAGGNLAQIAPGTPAVVKPLLIVTTNSSGNVNQSRALQSSNVNGYSLSGAHGVIASNNLAGLGIGNMGSNSHQYVNGGGVNSSLTLLQTTLNAPIMNNPASDGVIATTDFENANVQINSDHSTLSVSMGSKEKDMILPNSVNTVNFNTTQYTNSQAVPSVFTDFNTPRSLKDGVPASLAESDAVININSSLINTPH